MNSTTVGSFVIINVLKFNVCDEIVLTHTPTPNFFLNIDDIYLAEYA